ncbi:GDSL esterase/lipase At5g45960 isoform X3 [Capsella rubella]|uniref:GDSL esterase/lipase At5g45960 isoform X3 n=1 Tax=Capsella rubella TaxID=81985 RepID=UPI000CD58C8B|nr:GDSL esterase/lipase At5g45960 isoform X3 [Capsella rubella]
MRSHQTHSSSALSFIFFFFLLFISFSLSTSKLEPSKHKPTRKQSFSSILVFGDSTVDPGNNNFINTIFKCNFPPYGIDFKNKIPTGRFCNGRLVTDFIERVIDIPSQLEYFREYKRKLEKKMGKDKMEKHIGEALFCVSAGTNDFVINYFLLPIRRKTFTIEAYQQFVISNLKQFIQGLWKEGARNIIVAGVPPIGCLPIVITLFSSEALTNRRCIDWFSDVAKNYNILLQKELGFMQMNLAHLGSKIFYFDIYNPLSEIIHDYQKFGFEEVSSGCCGSGYLETSFLCNPKSYVCPNTSAYVFFDSIHPSEKTYFNIFRTLRPVYDSIFGCI